MVSRLVESECVHTLAEVNCAVVKKGTKSCHTYVGTFTRGSWSACDWRSVHTGKLVRANSKLTHLFPKGCLAHKSRDMKVDSVELKRLQRDDPTLSQIRTWISEGKGHRPRAKWQITFFIGKLILYRKHVSSAKTGFVSTTQLLLPMKLRESVMEVAHDSILGGHLGGKKTLDSDIKFLLARRSWRCSTIRAVERHMSKAHSEG